MYSSSLDSIAGAATGMIVLYVLAIVAGIVLHFTFLSNKNEGKFTGTLGWLYDFLAFRKLWIESILRLFYICTVCILCVSSIITLFSGFSKYVNFGASLVSSILILVLGNLIARILYELSLLSVLMCRNIIEINRKISGIRGEQKETMHSGASFASDAAADNNAFQDKPMFCKNCGAKITRPEAEFCTQCGHKR